MTEDSLPAIASAYQEAWTSKDFETARRYLADDLVFHSPQQDLSGLGDFLLMLRGFAERIEPRWEKIAATAQGDGVLILYNLFTLDGAAGTCADYFTIRNGKIESETLTFDPRPFAAARPREQAA
jgi:ketosteroid isomerase-like protein